MMLTLLIAFFSLIVLMIIHEFGHFIIAKKFGVKVEEFGIGYPPKIFGVKFGETTYSLNWVPLGAFVKIYGEEGDIDDYRSFSNLAIWKRILIVLGGVIAFWIGAVIIFSVAFGIGANIPIGDQDVIGITKTQVKITSVLIDSPAGSSGLKTGDDIVKAISNGKETQISKIADFQSFVQDNKGKSVTVGIERDGSYMEFNLTPRVSSPEDQGPTGIIIERIANVIDKYPWYEAPLKGIMYTGQVTWQALVGIYKVIVGLFDGSGLPQGAEVAGPIGITIFLSRAADFGAGFFLYFMGSLSVLLAIFNLFPIPALDGGKLLFLIIEKIQKKPVPVNWEQGITVFFFFLLITMSIFITIKFDVPRVVDFWKAGL
ncbi:MAG: hypothetical protein A2639_00760 [Candidatus Staskawiczbacteria bacterium RIFCSPHIGHO2_01_FULL_34_27]|nr:MAG: hypothetical protein A2639_00760 [Candidatus Staskawiczbacteria bacterium RIFCSPHIGHO2_01_FULL_34_27]